MTCLDDSMSCEDWDGMGTWMVETGGTGLKSTPERRGLTTGSGISGCMIACPGCRGGASMEDDG